MITSLVLKRKLESLREIEDIVSSMKAFANLNVQTAKSSLPHLRTYQNSIEDSFGDIITLFPHLVKEDQRETERTIYVVFLSQEGLCGFFNEDILNFFEEIPQENAITVIVGRKGIEAAQSREIVCERYLNGASNVDAIEINAAELSSYLIEIFEKEHFGKLTLIYGQLEAGSYKVVKKKVLPPDFSKFYKKSIQKEPLLYLKAEEILHALIKEYLHISIYRAFIESVASENQARLNAMLQAGNAIEERETSLTHSLNAERQMEHISMPMQVAIFFLHNEGYLEKLPLDQVELFIKKFITYLEAYHQDILETIKRTDDIDDYTMDQLERVADRFAKEWEA